MKTFIQGSLKAWIGAFIAAFGEAARESSAHNGHISSTGWWYIGCAFLSVWGVVYGVGNVAPPTLVTEQDVMQARQLAGLDPVIPPASVTAQAEQIPPGEPLHVLQSPEHDVSEGGAANAGSP